MSPPCSTSSHRRPVVPGEPPVRRQTVRRSAGLIIMAGSVGYVLWRLLTDRTALDLLGSVAPAAIAGLVALQGLTFLTHAYRYRLALEHTGGTSIGARYWFRLYIVGRFLNAFVPQAGNVYRGARLKEDYQISITRYLSGFVAFTWLSTLVNLLISVGVIGAVEPDIAIGEVSGLLITAVFLAVLAFGPLVALWLIRKFDLGQGRLGWARRRLEDLLASALSITRSAKVMVRFVLAALTGLGISLSVFILSFDALGLDVTLATILLFYVILQVSTYINITPGNLGVLELGFGALGAQIGIGLVGGLLVAALVRMTSYAALLITGLALGGLKALRRLRVSDGAGQAGP